MSKIFIEKLPIPQITADNKTQKALADQITQKVEDILRLKSSVNSSTNLSENSAENSSEISRLESEINALVYKLYDLTPSEIALIES